ncbi:hypothetical protein G9A89_016438 [Geosiphon pyriformis]|nr:hypothetical protein G9A89_016438 [Geosiphon pyriformis]
MTNLQKRLKTISPTNNSNNKHKNTSHHNNETKTTTHHYQTVNHRAVIIVKFQNIGNKIAESYKETNKIRVINITFYHNNLITNLYHQLITYQDHKIKTITINLFHNQYNNNISNLYQFSNIKHHLLNNNNNNRINLNNQLQKPNYYHTQSSYLTMSEEQNFQQTALFKGKATTPKSNPSNNTIPPAQIAQNTNLSDIFSFEFKANESPFLLSNAAVNKQKVITAIYTEAELLSEMIGFSKQYTKVLATCGTFNKKSEKALVFEFEEEKELPITETFMALRSTFNWAEETEQEIFEETRK